MIKKSILPVLFLVYFFSGMAQEKRKDTLVKTAIVSITTKYNPEISGAQKITKKPTLNLLKNSLKKKVNYSIYSAPVASTFIPKTGVVKGINLGIKETIYSNYLALGYGNYSTTFLNANLYKMNRFDNEIGISLNYNAANQNIRNSLLNSTFSNFDASAFFKKEARYFDWKVALETQNNKYNWFGLPTQNSSLINPSTIDELQTYSYFKGIGNLQFHDSYIKNILLKTSFFTDRFDSNEIMINFDYDLLFPLDFLFRNANDIAIIGGVEFLTGKFNNNYQNSATINYKIMTANLKPNYTFLKDNFILKIGFNSFATVDYENKKSKFLIFPEIFTETNIYSSYISGFAGITGNLHTNTYQKFSEINPYVSPTLSINQTIENSNVYVGFKGNLNTKLNYNIRGSLISEDNKPLFVRNNAKSNTNLIITNGPVLKSYEYGNSFNVIYDAVKTTSIFAEFNYKYNKSLLLNAQVDFNSYTAKNATEIWNLPTLQTTITGKFTTKKWFANTALFHVSERKDALYSSTFPSNINAVQKLKGFVDVNIYGGYHFNDKFTGFIRLNNLLNTKYQRFANFETQGFQVLGGISYKFDF
ncbi:TonB-dependent receptor [Polaribacter tangerinus]|uniref:TonB-dependent receptor n=1 Tax=Polaribacter tangerinus TaxID=1920034 RepID=UPI000B4B7915|nr:TonB-dependent receptor [Polaribacter tangerinus]